MVLFIYILVQLIDFIFQDIFFFLCCFNFNFVLTDLWLRQISLGGKCFFELEKFLLGLIFKIFDQFFLSFYCLTSKFDIIVFPFNNCIFGLSLKFEFIFNFFKFRISKLKLASQSANGLFIVFRLFVQQFFDCLIIFC